MREIARAVREHIHFMWLSGKQRPDFHTINRFRTQRLAPVIDEVFIESVKLLAEAGYAGLKSFFVDGTKVEANANRYSYVWRRAAEKSENKIDEKLRGFLATVKHIERSVRKDLLP